jgi:Pectate lyase superfamily protein
VGAAALVALAGMGSTSVVASAAPTAGVAGAVQLKQKPVQVPDFGPNVTIFDNTWTTAEIQAKFDEIHAKQVGNEMGSDRYALYFMPGTYGSDEEPLQGKVGYYTEVAGLGASPGDVQINGAIEVYNQCFDDPSNPEFVGCFALNNFWRGLSNLTINVNTLGQGGCEASANMWAVSQAVSMRRVDIKGGNLTLMDYCTGPSFASGGFIADSRAGVLINGSQQQWYTRNSEVSEWTNAVWNQVFSGVVGAPDDSAYPDPPYTTLAETPLSREKPYLYVDGQGQYKVRVPSAKRNTRGLSWDEGMTPGRSIPISDFYIADPSDSIQTINNQLARGKHLILTPGVYNVDKSIQVKRANTVVLGLGLATLDAVGGAIPMALFDRPGIVVAGVTIDAGAVESPVLLQVGKPNGNNGRNNNDASNPTTLSDVYFRVGGPHVGKVDIALQVNSDNVLIDHTWVWRADHGIEGFDRTDGTFGDNERWRTNIGRNGVVVNGDDVTATGFFVEHFQEYNTVWNGERGRVLLYQNELPYDPPTQADWTADDGTLGWAAYKVADNVKQHELWGGGVYVFNRNNPSIITENGYEVPDTPGVVLNHIMTNNLSGPGTINSVVNGFGDTVDGVPAPGDPDNYENPSYVIRYSDGVAVLP